MFSVQRSSLPELRKSFAALEIVVAEIDPELRYVWIENPHPDFVAAPVIGKRDDQLLPAAEAEPIMALKREALFSAEPVSRTIAFARSDGPRYYHITAYQIREGQRVDGLLTVGFALPKA